MTTDGIQNRFSRAEIAEALEISGNQILQYQERGLLADRTAHAQDIAYNSLDIARLRFVLRCEAAGYQGNDVIDFIGTIKKSSNIKDQLKASLVHAHQKFSYVNAQKRKADILEQVSLQADADLIQKYIDEMKGILADPQSSTLPTAPPKPRAKRESEPTSTPSSRFDSKRNWSNQSAEKPEQASKLKRGLERSQRFEADATKLERPQRFEADATQLERPQRFEADATQLSPPQRPSSPSRPKRTVTPKARSKFIDSSTASDEYNQRMSDSSQDDLYIDYSRSKKPNFAAWKQTIITFLLLSVFSLAGYTYYVLKFQKPSATSIEESSLSESPGDLDIEGNISANETANSMDSKEEPTEEVISSKENGKATTAPPASKDTDTAEPNSKPAESVEPEKPQSQEAMEDKAAENDTASAKTPPVVAQDDSSKDSSTMPPTSSSQTQSTDSSISDTAMKDLDDLLTKKQGDSSVVTEDYQIAERPQVAVYGFKIFYQLSRKILIAKFKIARIRPQRNLIQGRLFVVFKPRQSAQTLKYFSIPDARIADGIPTEPFKGIEFSFAESTKVQSVRTIYVRDPSQFDVATVFVFSNAGELVLRKDFTVNVTEY